MLTKRQIILATTAGLCLIFVDALLLQVIIVHLLIMLIGFRYKYIALMLFVSFALFYPINTNISFIPVLLGGAVDG